MRVVLVRYSFVALCRVVRFVTVACFACSLYFVALAVSGHGKNSRRKKKRQMTAQIKKETILLYYLSYFCRKPAEIVFCVKFVVCATFVVDVVVVVITLFLVHQLLLRQMFTFYDRNVLGQSGKRNRRTKYPKMKLTFGEVSANCSPVAVAADAACAFFSVVR